MNKQADQVSHHNQHAKARQFSTEQNVMVRNLRPGKKWVPGVIYWINNTQVAVNIVKITVKTLLVGVPRLFPSPLPFLQSWKNAWGLHVKSASNLSSCVIEAVLILRAQVTFC